MIVHENIQQLPAFRNAVITIGTFDGVHTGHRQIIQQLKEEAKAVNGESVIITFYPHPRMVLADNSPEIKLLNTPDEKIELLTAEGIDHLVIVPFTAEFSEQDAETYIRSFLVETFHPHSIIIGYDHHFGKNRQGNYKLLEQFAKQFNYEVKEIPKQVLHHVGISSTKIREALSNHDIRLANEFLGYEYFFNGKVAEGKKLGRTLGFPTANLKPDDANKLIPANGVYAVRVTIKRDYSLEPSIYKGMMNIGVRPTIDGKARTIEVHLFDFDSDIYNTSIRVTMIDFLREEIKFNSIDELKLQLKQDKIKALSVFEKNGSI